MSIEVVTCSKPFFKVPVCRYMSSLSRQSPENIFLVTESHQIINRKQMQFSKIATEEININSVGAMDLLNLGVVNSEFSSVYY